MGRFFSGGRLLAFLAGIILLVILAAVSLRSRTIELPWHEKFVLDVQSTVGRLISEPMYQVDTFFRRFHDLDKMYDENAALQNVASENAELQTQLADQELQNHELKDMLAYKSRTPQFHLIAAQVTGRSPLSWNSEITLSAGSQAGVKINMPVLSSGGVLVGRVTSVALLNSTATLITSPDSSNGVSASIVSSTHRTFGIVTGSPTSTGYMLMQFISQLSSGAKVGDLVVTSGLSDMYPRDIVIGRIRSFVSDGTGITRSAIVTPLADMNYLDYVFILAPKSGQVVS